MKRLITSCVALAMLGWSGSVAMAQQGAAPSRAEARSDATTEAKYSFLVFYKANNAATKAMIETVQSALVGSEDRATLGFANIADPAYKELVAQYSLSRAPMPLTLAIAPNGAVTGAFSQQVSAEELAGAFVSPAMMHCMKATQEGRIVLVHVHMSERAALPIGVREFCADKLYKDRVSVIGLRADDATEATFLAHVEVDSSLQEPVTVMIAPPGAFVGKFAPTATKDEMATALHKAGKCCEDENCKHNQKSQATKPTGARRN